MYHCRACSYLGHLVVEYFETNKQKAGAIARKNFARLTHQTGRAAIRLTREESGQAAIMAVLLIGFFLLGFMALALDVGFLFREKRMAQAAADAAAVAAAEQLSVGNPFSSQQQAANVMARMNGFDPTAATNPAKVSVVQPAGAFAAGTNFLEVDVSKPVQTLFLSTFHSSSPLVTVFASAVAGDAETSPTCICVEAANGTGLTMSNDAQIQAPTCGVTVDTSDTAVSVIGSATINALSLGTVSTLPPTQSGGGKVSSSTAIIPGVGGCRPPAPPSPSSALPSKCNPNPISGFSGANGPKGQYTLPLATDAQANGVVCYTSLDTSGAGGGSVNLNPNLTYYIEGNFTTGGGAPVSGQNVQFYVGGNVNIANGTTVNLTAPVDANGIPETLFYVNPLPNAPTNQSPQTVLIQGGSNSDFSGLVYAPTANAELNNGTGTTFQLDMVVNTLDMEGGAELQGFARPGLGTLAVTTPRLVQ